ncbi:DEAD/DEAH box helicase family protein [Candidatus Woesearchaeota archaeon]|jgi:hypothetical protein|nr:DEAD/DEAH box helicase family protein [Candidatus Woesearchaeota archaeon]
MKYDNLNYQSNPIDALEVAKSFGTSWVEFKNDLSGELTGLWNITCQHFNKVYINNHNNSPKEYFNIPAPTGSGKTQLLKYYASKLVKQRSDIGVLIVTHYVSEAEEAVKDINNWSNNPYAAAAYYSNSQISRDELYRFNDIQVAIITHENYIRNHNSDSTNHDIYQQLATFNNSDREVIIIDEEVNLINHIGINKRSVSAIESSLTMLASRTTNDRLNLELQLVKYLHNNYDLLFYQEHKHKRLIGKKDSLLRKISTELKVTTTEVKELFELQYLKDSIRNRTLGAINAELNTKNIDIYTQNLRYLLDDNLYECNSRYGYEYRTSTLEHPNKSIVILNATANLSSIGMSNAKTVVLPTVKTYEKVRLFKVKTDEKCLGKNVFDKLDNSGSEEDGFNQIPEMLYDFSKFDYDYENQNKKTVFFTHKKVKEALRIRDNITLDHFGNLLGVNKYRECNNVIIYGIQLKPEYIYIDSLIRSMGTDALLAKNKDKIVETRYAEISADIVQAINRGRCRRIIKGKAPKMDVQLLMPNNKKLTKQLLSFIIKSMPGIQVLDSAFEFRITKERKTTFKQIDKDFINSIDISLDEIKAKNIKDLLHITDKTWKRMLRDLTSQEYINSYLSIELENKGYSVEMRGISYHLIKNK